MLPNTNILLRSLYCCCFLLLSLLPYAQNAAIDSLQALLKTEKNDSMRSIIYIELASNYTGYDTAKTLATLNEA